MKFDRDQIEAEIDRTVQQTRLSRRGVKAMVGKCAAIHRYSDALPGKGHIVGSSYDQELT